MVKQIALQCIISGLDKQDTNTIVKKLCPNSKHSWKCYYQYRAIARSMGLMDF